MAFAQAPKATQPLPSRSVPASVLRMMAPRVAKKAAGILQSDSFEFTIFVNLAGGKSLGVDVDWVDGKSLFIKSVMPGALDDWNLKNESKAVKAGDRIIAVNGYSGNASIMVDECRISPELELLVRTKRRPAESASGNGDSSPTAKKPRLDGATESLYAGMPAPDPEKDKSGGQRAKELDIFSEPAVPESQRLVIFLDIDGVLRKLEGHTIAINGEVLPLNMHGRAFAPEAVRALKFIVHRTGAGIVLSSEWRRNNTLREEVATALRAVGLPPMRGSTAVFEAREEVIVGKPTAPDREATTLLRWEERRAREITEWLLEHPGVERWVALDDIDLSRADEVRLPDTRRMTRNLVRTTADEGLSMSNAREAVERLLKMAEVGS
mmetsp:Transcript_55581/g.157697  ORF Transcript_55581/g.157697 Transcript_55581/m.157697 type:complete len:381 (+) Transcript_55581:1-1143(+)